MAIFCHAVARCDALIAFEAAGKTAKTCAANVFSPAIRLPATVFEALDVRSGAWFWRRPSKNLVVSIGGNGLIFRHREVLSVKRKAQKINITKQFLKR